MRIHEDCDDKMASQIMFALNCCAGLILQAFCLGVKQALKKGPSGLWCPITCKQDNRCSHTFQYVDLDVATVFDSIMAFFIY